MSKTYQKLKNSPKSYPDHIEQYVNTCYKCEDEFLGFKNYPVCRQCTIRKEEGQGTVIKLVAKIVAAIILIILIRLLFKI